MVSHYFDTACLLSHTYLIECSGKNPYCIDKNYASVFIIWDKMFGTFAPEDEKVSYGLTTPVRSFDPLTLQFGHYYSLLKEVVSASSWKNRLFLVIKGPGWKPDDSIFTTTPSTSPAKEIKGLESEGSLVIQVYCAIHFFIVLLLHVQLSQQMTHVSQAMLLLVFSFVFMSLTSFGGLMEGKKWCEMLELSRCFLFVFLDQNLLPVNEPHLSFLTICVKLAFFLSLLYWTVHHLNEMKFLDKISKGAPRVRPIRD